MQELRSVLEKHGFHFKKQFGQNFISDTNLLKSIVEASGITKETTVVEIGCGAGTLTRALAEAAKKVYAFDIDRDLQPVLAETLAGLENVEVIFRDFNKLNLKEFEEEIEEYTVVANLPYYITTPIIMGLFESRVPLKSITIMVQKEVAAILGIDQRVYSNYETGKREIPGHFVITLAEFYNTTTDYIYGRTNNPEALKK